MGRYSKIDIALLAVSGKKLRTQIKYLCAEDLDYGLYRDVYVFKQDRRYVVKVERDMSTGQFANVTEWRNWIDNEEWKEFSRWLAPCHAITESGQILIQRRVYSHSLDHYPERIPALFTDTKRTNFGWIGSRFVCCDYSYLLSASFRLKKVKWWDVDSPPKT
ncbi:MAG TPA: hypothetical protein VFX97_16815 [Pyrinomonadaceae bacterium]|nr:hypothetical protein [Pyrinomonadaceae bacterium]